jgi:hypothetical protein
MTRATAPYGMLLDRGLTFDQLELAYQIAAADPDPKTNRRRLTMALRDLVSDQEAEGKTKKCLTRVWLNPPAEAESMISWARTKAISPTTDRRVLHFGALLATFPFAGSVARSLGKHFQVDGRVDAGSLRAEVRRTVGDRSSVDVAARKTYTTLRNLGIIQQEGQMLTPTQDALAVPPELRSWISHALLLTRQAESATMESLRNAPELLGLQLSIPLKNDYTLLEVHSHADSHVLVRP